MTTPSTSTGLLTALSPSLVAVVSSTPNQNSQQDQKVRVLLYQRSTGHLQTSLTASLKQSASSASTDDVNDDSVPRMMRLFFAGNSNTSSHSQFLVLVCQREWMAWDLNRGVVAYHQHHHHHHHSHDHKQEEDQFVILDACAYENDIYLLQSSNSNNKLRIHQYNAETGQLVRKIKAGRGGSNNNSTGLGANEDYLFLSGLQKKKHVLRVLNRATGAKVQKINLQNGGGEEKTASTGVGCCPVRVAVSSSNNSSSSSSSSLVATTLSSSGLVVVLDLNQPDKQWVSKTSCTCLDFVATNDDTNNKDWILLINNSTFLYGSASSFDSSSSKGDTSKVQSTKIVLEPSVDRVSLLATAAASKINEKQLVAVLCKDNRYQIQTVSFAADTEDDIAIHWLDETSKKAADDKKDSNNKRSRENDATILGPAQAGDQQSSSSKVSEHVGDSASSRKKSRPGHSEDDMKEEIEIEEEEDDDDDAPTIAERLAKLRQALEEEDDEDDDEDDDEGDDDDDEEEDDKKKSKQKGKFDKSSFSFVPKKATTESLTQLLQQSLQSGHDAMLELALTVSNATVVRNSCLQLDQTHLEWLLTALAVRLAQKPARGEALSVWITACLLQTRRLITEQSQSSSSLQQHLQLLQNLLHERVQVFPALLQLQGRLSMMSNNKVDG